MTKKQWIISGILLLLIAALSLTNDSSSTRTSTMNELTYAESGDGFDMGAEPALFDESRAMIATDSFMPEPPRAGKTAATADQRIIQTGHVTVRVNNVSESVKTLSALAIELDGFVQNSNAGEQADGSHFGSITIRVPSNNYAEAMERIRDAGLNVIDESTNVRDVTEQFTDLQARLGVAQEQEAAYLKLLDRAGSVSDLLEVQRELSRVRSTIESFQGQIQYLENQTSLSTITISLQELASVSLPTKPFQPGTTVSNALQSVVVVFQFLFEAIIWVVILGIGVALPVGVVAWLVRKTIQKRK